MKAHILHSGRIFTGVSEGPWSHAVAIVGGKIAALDQAALAWRSAPGTTEEDLNGALIIPGITDAHIHLMWYARSLHELDLRDLSRGETLDELRRRAEKTPIGTWITGRGWDQNIWSDRSFPTAVELDSVAPTHPVAFDAKNAHVLVANSAAMRAAGISAQTPDPPRGKIARDGNGNPTGLFFEEAIDLITAAKPQPDFATLQDMFDTAQRALLAQGITGVHDVDGNPAFAVEQELACRGRLRIRIVKYIRRESLDAAIAAKLRSGLGDDWLRLGGVKLFVDGALGSRTAALFAAYQEEPHNTGMLMLEPNELEEIAQRAVAGGLALAIHAIGDRANHLVVDTLMSVKPLNSRLRHRIEHAQLITPEDQRRLARAGFVASMQPTHAIHDRQMAERYWGNRSAQAYAWHSLLDAGANLAFGSDAPIEVSDPFLGLYAAVTRRSEIDGAPGPEGWYPEQRLTLIEALGAYTLGAAYAAGLEQQLGLLAPGYYADLVELDRDIFKLPPPALLETQVVRVMVNGEWQLL